MRALILTFSVILSVNVNASNFTWNGVLTQGLFHTDGYNIYGKSKDDVSFDFTELSLNGSYNLPKNLRLSGQAIYRHAGTGFDGVDLDYLFLEYQALDGENYLAGVRLGKNKAAYGLYNDSRDIAFTRPSIYLSQAIYWDLTLRQTLISTDGIAFYGVIINDLGRIDLEISYGEGRDDNLNNLAFFGGGSVDLEGPGLIYSIQFSDDSERILIAFSRMYQDSFEAQSFVDINPYIPSLPVSLDPISIETDFEAKVDALSFMYNLGSWIFTLEYGVFDAKSEQPKLSAPSSVMPFIPDSLKNSLAPFSQKSEGYYVGVRKIISKSVELFMRYDHLVPDVDDRDGKQFEESGEGFRHNRFAEDTMIGVRWLPKRNMMINAEYHYIYGSAWINLDENPNAKQNPVRYWDILALSFSYRF